jgi:hypothetical protein
MGFLDWMKRAGGAQQPYPERQPIPQYGPDEMAFRFQKPFAHLQSIMSPSERKVVEGIEARWKHDYEMFKNYPPLSETQENNTKVFRAVDDAYKALHAREHGAFDDWKRLEADVDKAIGRVREAFAGQRKYLEREFAEARGYDKQSAPDYRAGREMGRGWRER